jgi:hypothetical protein
MLCYWASSSDILKDCSAFIYTVKQSKNFDPDDDGTTVFRNTGNHSLNNTASQPRQPEYSSTLL